MIKDNNNDVISLVYGSGGAQMEEFIKRYIVSGFSIRKALEGVGLDALDDGASVKVEGKEIILTMDAHTVDPIFFPGGDIGSLAICGTINDLAVMGAQPIAILDSIIVEEGLKVDTLKKIIE